MDNVSSELYVDVVVLRIRRPPRSTASDTLFLYATLFLSPEGRSRKRGCAVRRQSRLPALAGGLGPPGTLGRRLPRRRPGWLDRPAASAPAACAGPGPSGGRVRNRSRAAARTRRAARTAAVEVPVRPSRSRSEEHTSELQSLMRTSYAVFCLKNKTRH